MESKIVYNEFIQNIINTRGQWGIPKNEYFEVHHILPQCMGGEPFGKSTRKKHKNLIWLYPREHFIAHKLLYLENPDNNKLFYAWWMMAFVISDNQERYEITPEEYEELAIYKSKINSELFSTIERTSEWRNHISEGLKGVKKGHWYNNGECSVQAFECPEGFVPGRLKKDIDKIHSSRRAGAGYKKSDENKAKISNAIKSKKYHWYNNGTKSIQIQEGQEIPEGFNTGKLTSPNRIYANPEERNRKVSLALTGILRFTNGDKNIALREGEPIPEGFHRGTTIKNNREHRRKRNGL